MSALKKPALDESESCTAFSTDYGLNSNNNNNNNNNNNKNFWRLWIPL